MKNYLSFSSSPLTRMIRAEYYDLESTLNAMEKLLSFSIIHGFELQHLAEWQKNFPPRDNDPRYDRYEAWNSSIKYNIKEITDKLNKKGIPILSVHGNRDIGILCCSGNAEDIKNAKRLILEAIQIVENSNAKICVFHVWDANNDKFDSSIPKDIIKEMTQKFPDIQLSTENIPTKLNNFTPFELVKEYKWVTLDLRWAAIYDELNKFFKIKHKIINIHIRGTLAGSEWQLKKAPFTVYEALDKIINEWKYKGLLTIEPEGGLTGASWENLIEAIIKLKKHIKEVR